MAEHTHANDYALVIGINEYPDWSNGKRNLRGPAEDAQDFYSWLIDAEKGGGLPEKNTVLVISRQASDDDPRPDGQDITRALRKINRARFGQEEVQPIRRLYLFFSGHGHTEPKRPRNSNLCMAPFNEFDGLSEALSLEDIISKTIMCIAPQELVVFLDCCRSVIRNAAGVDTGFGCSLMEDAAGQVKLAILYSTLNFKLSFESGDDQVRGHFTTALMDGLKGQAALKNGKITLESLFEFLKVELPRVSDNPKNRQEIDKATVSVDLKDIVLRHEVKEEGDKAGRESAGPDDANITIHFSPERSGDIILENGNLEIVHQANADTGPWMLSLERGTYSLLEAGNEENFFSFQVRVVDKKQEVTF